MSDIKHVVDVYTMVKTIPLKFTACAIYAKEI